MQQSPQGRVSWAGVVILIAIAAAIVLGRDIVGNVIDAIMYGVVLKVVDLGGIGALVAFTILCFVAWGIMSWRERRERQRKRAQGR